MGYNKSANWSCCYCSPFLVHQGGWTANSRPARTRTQAKRLSLGRPFCATSVLFFLTIGDRKIFKFGCVGVFYSGHPERRAKPEVEGSLVSKGDPSTPPRCGSAQDDSFIRIAKLQFERPNQKGTPNSEVPFLIYKIFNCWSRSPPTDPRRISRGAWAFRSCPWGCGARRRR